MPKTFIKLCLLGIVIITVNCSSKIDDDPVISKLLAYKKLVEKHATEKIHIHINQPQYHTYDTVWFKGYVVNAYFNSPSAISKLLYVDLLNGGGKLIKQVKLPLTVGLAPGWFALSDTLATGTYRLRAYTNQMKAFGAPYYYERTLVIKNSNQPAVAKTISVAGKAASNNIQFFPEGGNLVNGIPSVMAFKAVNNAGMGIDVSGAIVDEQGNNLTTINSAHLGMGTFKLTPMAGHSYWAQVTFKDGTTTRLQLAAALAQGYTMQLTHTVDSIHLIVNGSTEMLNKGKLTVVASQDGVTRYVSQFGLPYPTAHKLIPENVFYGGVAQFTLFDENGVPVAERLIYIDKKDELLVTADVKKSFAKRELVKLPISLKNTDGKPDVASLSVSVYNTAEYSTTTGNDAGIKADMLLTADLKGYVEQPNYYFDKPNDADKALQLDALLLTQGWRRFSWRDVLSKALPAVQDSVEDGIQLAGHVNIKAGKPYTAGEVSLLKAGSLKDVWQTKTDSAGYFAFKDLKFTGAAKFALSTNTSTEKKDLHIQLQGNEVTKAARADVLPDIPLAIMPGMAENERLDMMYTNSKSTMLNQVNIAAGKPKPKVTESYNLNGPGRADAIVTANELASTVVLSTYLSGHISGITYANGNLYARAGLPNTDPGSPTASTPMSIVYDGVNIGTAIDEVNVNDIATIEVLKSPGTTSLYGIDGMGGVLVISSKRGADYTTKELSGKQAGILPVILTGYEQYKEFYSPVYSPARPVKANAPDFRKALYWNPNVTTNAQGLAELSFYNSDYIGPCKIVIEGINADGQLARAVYQYEVK